MRPAYPKFLLFPCFAGSTTLSDRLLERGSLLFLRSTYILGINPRLPQYSAPIFFTQISVDTLHVFQSLAFAL